MMYQKLGFVDRVDNKPTSYIVDGQAKIIEKDDTGMISRGTSLNADNLNYLEDGIYQNSVKIDELSKDEYATLSVQDYVTSLPNSVDGYLDMELEGNTLVNLLGTDGSFPSDKLGNWSNNPSSVPLTISQGVCTFTASGVSQGIYNNKVRPLLQSEKLYTVILTASSTVEGMSLSSGVESQLAIPITTSMQTYRGRFVPKAGAAFTLYADRAGTVELSKIMLLEGDYTNKPLPSYFEGIKSVDSCVIKSIGKNLFSSDLEIGTILPDTGQNAMDANFIRSKDFIRVKPNIKYIYTDDTGVYRDSRIFFYDKNKKYLNYINQPYFTTPSEAYYLKFRDALKNTTIKCQLEEGTVATSYEPYREDKIDILTQLSGDKSLKRIPNGVADIYHADGNVNRKIGKMVLDGTQDFVLKTEQSTGVSILFHHYQSNAKTAIASEVSCLSNVFNSVTADFQWLNWNFENVSLGNKNIGIRVLKSKLTQYGLVEGNTATYVPAFTAWLKANPTTVYYELAEPTTEQLPPFNLQSFKNGQLIIDSPIPPIATVKYPINLGGAVSSITTAVNNVENRTGKLEEGLFVTTAKTIENSEKIKNLSSQGAITKFTLTDKVPTDPSEFAPGEIKLVYK